MQFSADGRTLAAHSADGRVKVFDMPDGRLRATTARRQHPIDKVIGPHKFILSPDGRRVAIVEEYVPSDKDMPVPIYDAGTGLQTAVLHGETRALRCLAFSPDGKTLATGHGEARWVAVGWIKLWDADTGRELVTLWGHRSGVHDLLFTQDGKRLLSAASTEIKFWDPVVGQEVMSLPGGGKLQMTPDCRTLAVGPDADNDSRVRIWRAASADEVGNRDGK